MLRQVPPSKKSEAAKPTFQSDDLGEYGLFTEEELDNLLDPSAISQEIKDMYHRGVAPSQVTADVTEAVRWQDKLHNLLNDMAKSTPGESRPWVGDLIEDLIAFEVSPSHTVEETKVLLTELKKSFVDLENSGFGPEARNFITSLRAELDILVEKLDTQKA